jgi:proprotein convertase subtilisin/kexin type 2
MADASRSNWKLLASLCLASLLLASCGGGGGDDGGDNGGGPAPIPPPPPPDIVPGADPLLSQQWHLAGEAQIRGSTIRGLGALDVWPQTKGQGVRVTVVDDAVQTDHEDLAPNVIADGLWNYLLDRAAPPLPSSREDRHGTAVAGIIAARDENSLGGAGVAPRVSLAGNNALATETTADVADALNRALEQTSVYNNSWGSPDNGTLHVPDSIFVNAIRSGVENGRGRLGSIYVFPSGNGGIEDNSNYDGYVSQFGMITVCAVGPDGRAPQYSEPGANVLVCGPSGGANRAITTTIAPSGYIDDFAGTSASVPMVSGVAALLVGVRPDLSWRDVRLILAHSARRTDPSDADWAPGAGGALAFNHRYGFGAVDAPAAVELARSWTTVGGSESLIECAPQTASPRIELPDATNSGQYQVREHAIDIACPISHIEYVEIGFEALHSYSGDLQIELVSPNGLVSRLAENRACKDPNSRRQTVSCGNYTSAWRFLSVRHLEEAASGRWTLRVSDRQAADTGTWNSWSLRFWGR